jgi:protein-tyrosine phosphatase
MGPRAELHFHLLPAIDDGPADLDAAIALARAAVADGTGTLVCTPHARCVEDVDELLDRVSELQDALDDAHVPLRVHAGAELAAPDVGRMRAADLAAVAQGPPHARWLLLEAPLERATAVDALHEAIAELAARGYGIALAHPERCPDLMGFGGGLQRLIDAGVALQVNASSVIGDHGAAARDAAWSLLSRGAAALLASDAHSQERPPCLGAAVAQLAAAELPDPERLVEAAPHALLRHGLPVPALPAAAPARR